MSEQPLPTRRRMTISEYLEFERHSETKHELVDGEPIAMSGGSAFASSIEGNVIGELRSRLKGTPCRQYTSNLKIRIPRNGRFRYADAFVICGPTEFDPDDEQQQTITNPRLIVEVLSPTTEREDRGRKFADYRSIASFEEYVLVSQSSPTIETFRRQPDGAWRIESRTGIDAVTHLASLGIDLPHAEIFANVVFAPDPEDETPTV